MIFIKPTNAWLISPPGVCRFDAYLSFMLFFDQRGLLIPSQPIPSSLSEVEAVFVQKIGTAKRRVLYDNYLQYITELKGVIGNSPFRQWIDGSFSTLEPNLGDIDVVSFISFDVVDKFDKTLRPLRFPDSLKAGVDAYIVRVYPPDHRLFALYAGDRAYWMDKFDKKERNRRGIIHQKGFIEITFSVS